ncbi:hypothetical protein Patl1_03693 [Pistacia atlantica]|uniref:Uncharacterized protein n=1 Tax=Pistacia atlantica TaxID=434234 RepID=A0ACC1BSU6_9ROSI|nr:hypothetical protein Patl1_03693 [Pistacia atlantica]
MILPSSLIGLIIAEFPNLRYLSSKGFQHLDSLKHLQIRDCPNMASFPEAGLPSSLLQLRITAYPLLKKQCMSNKGQDWSKIAHIPRVEVDGKFVFCPYEDE